MKGHRNIRSWVFSGAPYLRESLLYSSSKIQNEASLCNRWLCVIGRRGCSWTAYIENSGWECHSLLSCPHFILGPLKLQALRHRWELSPQWTSGKRQAQQENSNNESNFFLKILLDLSPIPFTCGQQYGMFMITTLGFLKSQGKINLIYLLMIYFILLTSQDWDNL